MCKGPEAEMGMASRTGEKAGEAGVVAVGRKEAGSDDPVGFFCRPQEEFGFYSKCSVKALEVLSKVTA